MATWEHELLDPPPEPRARELWLQHAAGLIVFEDVRRYAIDQIDPALTGKRVRQLRRESTMPCTG